MARSKKENVDYFPHTCKHGSTMFILEQRYSNNGYAFWFKLLELLGDTKGHFIDCNDPAKWEFLQAITHLSENICIEILDLLAKLNAIDNELWKEKIIWSDNFIKGIVDVYINRRVEIPAKPYFYSAKPRSDVVSTVKSTQSKVKESKVNNNICRDEESKQGACDSVAPKNSKISKAKIYTEEILRIVEYLNTKLNAKFSTEAKTTVKVLTARLKENYVFEDFQFVIDNKYIAWNTDVKMNKFLRPETLFGEKFDGYLNEVSLIPKKKENIDNGNTTD